MYGEDRGKFSALPQFVYKGVYDVNCIALNTSNFSVLSQKRQNSGMQRGKRTNLRNRNDSSPDLRTAVPTKSDSDVIFCLKCQVKHYLVHSK